MTISVLLMMLAFAVGSGTGQSIQGNSTTTQTNSVNRKIIGHCYINGVLVNPCPPDNPNPPSRDPDPLPEILQPN